MKKVCAWCEKDLGEVPADKPTSVISHGICEECIKRELEKLENSCQSPQT